MICIMMMQQRLTNEQRGEGGADVLVDERDADGEEGRRAYSV